jgi:thiamine-phosphate pyrophosphorylase
MRKAFPKVYPILDSSTIPATDRLKFLMRLGASLTDAGVTLLEYRNKAGADTELMSDAAILRAAMPRPDIKLILDDRTDLVDRVGFDGVHVDSGDSTPSEARRVVGPDNIVGTFGGSEALVPGILEEPADYLSVGPAYPTSTKQTTKPAIGPEGVRRLRKEAGPDPILVAVGGVTLESASELLAAGANAVAVSAAIFRTKDPAAEFRRWLQELG